MKIVQLITRMDTIGGAQVHVRDLAVRLKEEGHTIYVVTGGREHTHALLEKEQIQPIYCKQLIHRLNIVSDLKAVFEIRNVLKAIQPDLIATHSSKAGIVGRIAGWSLRIPTIFTAHGWSFTEGVPKRRKKVYTFFEKMIGFISAGGITVSTYDKELALKHTVLPEGKLNTIHNGVHDIEYVKKVRDVEGEPVMIMVARFSPQKNQLQLLEVLRHLKKIGWKLYFAGEGPLLTDAKRFVESEKLTERVFFLGDRGDIADLLQQADLFVLVSEWEGLPLSILEAMRGGLPIIATDVGGVGEAVRQSVNGFVVAKDDVEDLQAKLSLLLTDAELRQQMGDNSRMLYERHFTFERMYTETITYYEKVLETAGDKAYRTDISK